MMHKPPGIGMHLYPISTEVIKCKVCKKEILRNPKNRKSCDEADCKAEMQRLRAEKAARALRKSPGAHREGR